MNAELPIYQLVIDESKEQSGVTFISLVDIPAIKTVWQKFNSAPIKFSADNDRQIVSAPAMIADLPIYRRDEKFGEYYVVFDKKTIEKIAMKFMRQGNTEKVNLMHNVNAIPSDVFIFESFIVDSQRGIASPKGFDLPDGSWFVSMKVNNTEVWNNIDKFNGFSVEGLFDMVKVGSESEKDIIKEIESILKK